MILAFDYRALAHKTYAGEENYNGLKSQDNFFSNLFSPNQLTFLYIPNKHFAQIKKYK